MTVKIRVVLIDLIYDGSWSQNGSYNLVKTIEVPDELVRLGKSDAPVSRRILEAVGCTNCGYKRDSWCQSDFGPWRREAMGIYADILTDGP